MQSVIMNFADTMCWTW